MDIGELWGVLQEKLGAWLHTIVEMLPNLVLAVFIMLGFVVLARGVRSTTHKLLSRLSVHAGARSLLVQLTFFATLATGLMLSLSILQLDKVVTSVLAGAGIVGLALGFAFQDLAANFISGIGLSVRRPFRVGDIIETNDVIGTAHDIALRTTTVLTFDGKYVLIPNKEIFQNKLINHSTADLRRIDLECGISYGDDLEKVKRVSIEALQGVSTRDTSRDVKLYFTGFGDSSINFVAHYWVPFDEQADYLSAMSEGVMRLKKAYDENDITIPFPIRTLDFGIKGGQTLAEVLPSARPGLASRA